MAREPKSRLERKTEDELIELALAIFKGDVFTDRHIEVRDGSLAGSVFMPLGMMDRKQKLDLMRKDRPGMIYAYMRDAGPRAINGYPMFFSCSMLHPEDTALVWEKYRELEKLGTTNEGESVGQR